MKDIHSEGGTDYGNSYVLSEKSIKIMEGKLLTLVELLGLPTEQSEALKSEIRQKIWGGTVLKYGQFVYCENMPELSRIVKQMQEIEQKKQLGKD